MPFSTVGEVSAPPPKSLFDIGGESTARRISHELPGCNWLEEKIKKAKVVAATAATAAGSNGNGAGALEGQKKKKEDAQQAQPLKSKSDR